MKAHGEPGGLLVVSEYPGQKEDETGVPFTGKSGLYLRWLLEQLWKGPVVYDNAIRCAPFGTEVSAGMVSACRGYLAQTVREAAPERVLALGGTAVQGLLGRSVPLLSVRRAYGWLYNENITDTGAAIPVFMLVNPAFAKRNRIVRKWFESDVKWALSASPALPPWDASAFVVETADDAREACARLAAANWFAWDVETCGVLFESDFRVLCLSACPSGSRDAFVWDERALADGRADPLLALLADPKVRKVGHNLKYDSEAMRSKFGALTRNHFGDTRLWRKLVAAHADAELETVVELIGMGGMKEEAERHLAAAVSQIQKARQKASRALPLLGLNPVIDAAVARPTEKPKRYAYGLLPRDVLLRYNARDSVGTTVAGEHLEGQLQRLPQLRRVWDRIVCGASEAYEQVETWGVAASRENAQTFQVYLEARLGELRERLSVYDGLNPDSAPSVAKLLYETLGLPPVKETKGGALSTDKEALKALAGSHPVVDDIREWRRLTKLHGTYAVGVPSNIRSDGRIHPSILLDGAETGRTSCKEPNLQNIARPSTVEAKMARDLFVAPPGMILLEADYSQLELRVATMLSGDPAMLDIWLRGLDYHQKTAELIAPIMWGIDASQVTSEHRSIAKTVNFGIIYGRTEVGLAKQLGCSPEEAGRIIEAVKGQFKKFAEWCARQLDVARRTGYCHTWWDGEAARRRALWNVVDHDDGKRKHAENAIVNTPIQGTASDFCVASVVAVVDWILSDFVPAKLVLTVHDSLLFELEESALEEVAVGVRRIMTQWPSAGVPLVVDMKVGQAWGSLKKYEPPAMAA